MADSRDRDYYADLGLTQHSTNADIKAAFHTLAKQHHPDKSGNTDTTAFRQAREAYEKLTDVEFRTAYDRDYHRSRMHYQTSSDEAQFETRTATFEAELREQEARGVNRGSRRGWSPPPKKPVRKTNEPSWSYVLGKPYQAWEKRDAAWRERHSEQVQPTIPSSKAHGLRVQMSSHPSLSQLCTMRTQNWSTQPGGVDYCIFCLKGEKGCKRCPGCEALACGTCLEEIIKVERTSNTFAGFGSKSQYTASGG